MKRAYVNTSGPDVDATKKLIKAAIDYAKRNNSKCLFIISPTLNNVGVLKDIFGKNAVKNLRKGFIDSGLTIKIESLKTYQRSTKDCVVVSNYLSSDELFKLEDYHAIKGIFAIPWKLGECNDWASAFGVQDLLSGNFTNKSTLNCVVEKALNQLSSVNKQILHTYDKDRIKSYIKILNQADYPLDKNAIQGHLYEANWTNDSVQFVIELVNKLNEGSYFKGGDTSNSQKLLNKWKDECKTT